MPDKKTILNTYEEQRKLISRFNLTSDIFFCKVMEDFSACEEFINILTGKTFYVKEVRTQYSIRNIETHSVVLDVLAEAKENHKETIFPSVFINIEMQISENEDHLRRTRFHQSCIDVSILEKGIPYKELPDLYILFITEKDFIGDGSAIYSISRQIKEFSHPLENGVHEIYVNLKGKTEQQPLQQLLSYINNTDSTYQTPLFPNLINRVKFLKEQKEGNDIMYDVMQDITEKIKEAARKEGRKEGIQEGRKEGIQEGKKEGEEIGMHSLINTLLEINIDENFIINKLMEHYHLNEANAKEVFQRYS